MSDLTKNFLKHDAWLSRYLKRDCYILNHESINTLVASEFQAFTKTREIFVSCKIPLDFVPEQGVLVDLGFRLIEVSGLFQKLIISMDGYRSSVGSEDDLNVRRAGEHDRGDIGVIASSAFVSSRFHIDPKIDSEIANRIKKGWATNYFSGNRGNDMFVVEYKGRTIGFCLLIEKREDLLIDLIAIDREFQGKGAGKKLIHEIISKYPKSQKLLAGTQLSNKSSVFFYQALGFDLVSSGLVYHFHS